MNHADAVRTYAVEGYTLEELNALEAGFNHSSYGVVSAAADTNHFNVGAQARCFVAQVIPKTVGAAC